MYKAGFRWIHYGAEAGSQDVLDRLGKRVSVEAIRNTIALSKAIGFRVRSSWILDAPLVSERSISETVKLILETQAQEIRVHYLALRAGAPLWSQAKSTGGSNIPEQYLHAGHSHSSGSGELASLIEEKSLELIEALASQGYLIIEEPNAWRQVAQMEQDRQQELKFAAFCPARYGINWRI